MYRNCYFSSNGIRSTDSNSEWRNILRDGTTTLATTGATGGTFSAAPAGLVIDATTGVIDLGASAPNTYDITYSFGTAPCTGTATSQVTVSSQPTATVSGGTFCATGTTTLTTTGATGGTFSATPAGLVIDANTGVIDLGALHLIHMTLLTVLELHHVTELLHRK
jgi:hypothetical protein